MDLISTQNSENADILKGGNLGKGSVARNVARKRLGDISNFLQQQKHSSQVENVKLLPNSTKLYIEQLQKENVALRTLLADTNKIIELSGIELQKLRINLQNVQEQNRQLAQTNSKMLGELNSSKDRLKALNHELGCKDGLLKALKFQEKSKLVCHQEAQNDQSEVGTSMPNGEGESCQLVKEAPKNGDKACNANRRRQSRNQPIVLSGEQVKATAQTENKRPCLRGRSARLKSEVPERTRELFEIDDAKFPICRPGVSEMHDSDPSSSGLTIKEEEREGYNTSSSREQELRRTSTGRPLRQAVEKIPSYKEMSIKIKLRRPE